MGKARSQTRDLDIASRGASSNWAHEPLSRAHAAHSASSSSSSSPPPVPSPPKPPAAAAARTAAVKAAPAAPRIAPAPSSGPPRGTSRVAAASEPAVRFDPSPSPRISRVSPFDPRLSPRVSRVSPSLRNSSTSFASSAGGASASSPAAPNPSGDPNATCLCVRSSSVKNARSLAAAAVASLAAANAASAHDSDAASATSAARSSSPIAPDRSRQRASALSSAIRSAHDCAAGAILSDSAACTFVAAASTDRASLRTSRG